MEEGHLLADHVHMLVSIPPKYSVAQVIAYIKAKSAIHIAREFAGRRTSWGNTARGYYVSTVARMNESCGNTSSSRNAKTGGWGNYGLEE